MRQRLSFAAAKRPKEFLENLVEGKKIIIREQILDQRGRPLALIYQGNKLINEEILKLGWARYHSDNSSQKGKLREAFESSQRKPKRHFLAPNAIKKKTWKILIA